MREVRVKQRYRYVYVRRRRQPTGEQLKQEGAAIAVAAVPEWTALAKHTLYHVIAPGTSLDSEILINLIGLPRVEPGLHRNNAVGGVFIGAASRGIIERVGEKKSERPISHANNHNTWVRTYKEFVSKVPCPHCPGFI